MAFVNTCMHQLHAGLQLDHTDKKQRVAVALQTHVLNKEKSAAERVLEGRFVLGADDSAYLQTGMATLWSTAPTDASTDGLDKGLALAPPGLYTPEAVGGIRAGLVRALKAKTKALERNAPADLAALVPALRLLLETPAIRNAVIGGDMTQQKLDTLLQYKWAGVAKDADRETRRAELLDVLRKLKTYLESAKGGKGEAKHIADLILGAIEKQAGDLAKSESVSAKRLKAIGSLKKNLKSCRFRLARCETEKVRLNATLTAQGEKLSALAALLTESELEATQCEEALEACKAAETVLLAQTASDKQDRAEELKAARASKNEAREQLDEARAKTNDLKLEMDELKHNLEECKAKSVEYEQEASSLKESLTTKDYELARLQDDLEDCRKSEDSLLEKMDAEELRKAEIRKAVSAGPNWDTWLEQAERTQLVAVSRDATTPSNVHSINDANSTGQPTLSAIINAHGDDDIDLSDWVVARGLVGQRGPACAAVAHEADADIAAVDARLPYALPSPEKLGAVLPHLKLLLDGTDEPTEAEVHAALATDDDDDACGGAATAVETLAAFGGNYAVLGEPVDANDDRGGIEVPHAVRWLPATGAAGRAAARVAMLEHVMARCAQLAESDATSTPVKAALREAAATLKLSQMASLYATREAVAYDEPERSGCWHAPSSASAEHGILVTRPCAIVRGALSFPVDAGVFRVACDRRAESVLGDAAEAKAAKAKYHEATLRVRTQARAKGRATNIYVAPPARELRFASAGTTAAATGATLSEDVEVTEDVTPDDFTTANWLRIVNRALVATSALVPENGAAVERVEGLLTAVGEEGVTAEQRRDGLWTEFRRHSAISQDRLWVFLRLLSGAVGGEVNEVITTADEATLRATRAIQDQRVQIAKRVSDMQAKIVETVVGSMAKDSKLTLDKNGNQLVVVDAEARKQLSDLASGESGRPFFEANVAVRNLQSSDANAPKPTLSQLLASLSQVGGQMQRSLEQTLTQPGTASASLAELSHPANCYFVTLRPDAVAAIRVAHERMNVELGLRGAGRRLSLWETIEGGCTMLTTRFAEFAGHVLVQARSTTGISAMYVSPQAIHTNASQARVALERLVHVAGAYTMSVGLPNWTALRDKNADLGEARAAIMNAGSTVEDHEVGSMMRRVIQGTPMRSRLSTHRHVSGWEIVGLATR